MFNFFLTKHHPIATGTKIYPKFDYIKRRYVSEAQKVEDYYHRKVKAIENRNLFSRLVFMLQPSLDLSLVDYFRHVDSNSEYMSRSFGLVSNISRGKVFEDMFYKNNSYSIINYVENNINIFKIEENWEKLRPLKCVYTTSTDLDFYQMDKSKSCKDFEFTVMELDVNLMLLQFRYWAKDRLKYDYSTNPNNYVLQLLYPNMVTTMLDQVLFNRFMYLFYNHAIPDFNYDHPFYIVDMTTGIDNIYRNIIKDFKNSNAPLEQILRTIPGIHYNNMLEALYVNRPYYSNQSEWSIWLTRIKYINFLIDFMGDRGRSRNRHYITTLPAMVKRLENRSTSFHGHVPVEVMLMFKDELELLKAKVGKR